MKRTFGFGLAVWLLAALVGSVGFGCDKDGEGEDDVAWPEQPADGCPVAFEFVEFVGEGEQREAKMRLFNFSDHDVRSLNMTLHYLGEGGTELDTFPWGATAPALVAANNHVHLNVGVFIPAEATSVSVSVEDVQFLDGTSWEAPETE